MWWVHPEKETVFSRSQGFIHISRQPYYYSDLFKF
jgi:hypothetical protein